MLNVTVGVVPETTPAVFNKRFMEKVMADNKNKTEKKKFRLSSRNKRTLWCYAILSTQIIGLVVFVLYPTLWAWGKAFYYDVDVPSQLRFVGLDNFKRIFTTDRTYWQSWWTTFIFTIGKMPFELPIAMLLAVCLTRKSIKAKGFFRAIYYLPAVISSAIIGLIMSSMFDYFGVVNKWLIDLGILEKPLNWFGDTGSAMAMLVIMSTWASFGTNVLYFMGALNNVPTDVIESATIDGATPWQIFINVKLPIMAPVLQTVILLALNGTLHTGEFILATTNGAPYGSTYTVMAYQVGKYVKGFGASQVVDLGYGAAVCVLTSIFMMIIAFGYNKLTKKLQNIY